MAIATTLRNEVDRKEWEMMTPCLASSAAGSHTICDPSGEDRGTMFIVAPATVLRYDHKHDAWQQLPASGAAGTLPESNHYVSGLLSPRPARRSKPLILGDVVVLRLPVADASLNSLSLGGQSLRV